MTQEASTKAGSRVYKHYWRDRDAGSGDMEVQVPGVARYKYKFLSAKVEPRGLTAFYLLTHKAEYKPGHPYKFVEA